MKTYGVLPIRCTNKVCFREEIRKKTTTKKHLLATSLIWSYVLLSDTVRPFGIQEEYLKSMQGYLLRDCGISGISSHILSQKLIPSCLVKNSHKSNLYYRTNVWMRITLHLTLTVFAPAPEKMIHITTAISKDTGEPVHKCSVARAFVVRRHIGDTLRKVRAKPHVCSRYRWLRICFWNVTNGKR